MAPFTSPQLDLELKALEEVEGIHKLKGSAARLEQNKQLADGQGDQYLPGQRRNATHISRLQVGAGVEGRSEGRNSQARMRD